MTPTSTIITKTIIKTSIPTDEIGKPRCSYCQDYAVVKVIFSFGMIRFCSDHFLPFTPEEHFGEEGLVCEPEVDMVDVTPVLGAENER